MVQTRNIYKKENIINTMSKVIVKVRVIFGVFLVIVFISYLVYSSNFNKNQINYLQEESLNKDVIIEDLRQNQSEYLRQVLYLNDELSRARDDTQYYIEKYSAEAELRSEYQTQNAFQQETIGSLTPFQERVVHGISLSTAYTLLSDYNDFTKQTFMSMKTGDLNADAEKIYNWIGKNYLYCGDKGMRVGNELYNFQFWSPDEMLSDDNSRCGDCDDHAFLLAGGLYSLGYSSEKVQVVCGTADGIGHCWTKINGVIVDPTCSNALSAKTFLGIQTGTQQSYPYSNARCFSNYFGTSILTIEGYQNI